MAENYQFGRFVEVEVRDFESKIKTVIGNDFEIEFEYFKSLDQTQEDDSGKISIFGLTPDRVKSMQSEGGEVLLRCGYLNSEIDILFIAKISRLYSNTQNNISVTTIECSANLLNFYYTGGLSVEASSKRTIAELAGIYGKMLGAKGATIDLPKGDILNQEEKNLLTNFVNSYTVKGVFVGNFETILRNFCDSFGLIFRREPTEDGLFLAVFEVSLVGVVKMGKIIESGYVGVTRDTFSKNDVFLRTLKDNDENYVVTILNPETGLIESKTEYKIATAYIDQELNDGDVETLKSQQQRANETVRDSNKAIKEAEKERKAKESGKPVKKSKWKKRETIKVTRRYNRVKALLNPLVKPQSTVAIFESSEVPEEAKILSKTDDAETKVVSKPDVEETEQGEYQTYRVRSATYKGNNKRGDWIMDLYCEDSTTNNRSEEELKYLERATPSEDFQVEGLDELISE